MKKIKYILSAVIFGIILLLFLFFINNINRLNYINNSVVYIESVDDESIKSGSGFVYKVEDNKNYIVTSYHVIEGYEDIYVYNEKSKKEKAKIINYDEYTDIAILRIQDNLDLKAINIGNSEKTHTNENIYVVGSPLNFDNINTITEGIITHKNKKITVNTTHGSSNLETIEINAKVDYGNSGGPLLNKKYNVIGMVFVKESNSDLLGFALPINYVMKIVEKLEDNKLKRPNLGAIMCNSTNFELLSKYNIETVDINGVVILKINPLGVLDNAKLQKGDIITKFDNIKIENVNKLREELYKEGLKNTVVIEYYRDGYYYTVQVEL